MHIPCCAPRLPSLEKLREYLLRIDETRWYSNFGPLSAELDERLGHCFGHQDGVATVANGTMGLSLALATVAQGPGLCLVPSWTFVATGHAVVNAGLTPMFVDVDPATGVLDVGRCRMLAKEREVAAAVVVGPFGAPIDLDPWRALRDDTGCAVVLDAAAGFDTARASDVPTVVSLHATKILPAAEGGAVACTSTEVVDDVRRRSNFGFYGNRIAKVSATNAKMSEYHAAVGLASLDEWASRRAALQVLADAYRARLPDGIALDDGWGETWLSATCPARLAEADAVEVEAELARRGVEARRWWGDGLHCQPAFAHVSADPLPNTETLARRTLGLPFFLDMTVEQVEEVAAAVGDVL